MSDWPGYDKSVRITAGDDFDFDVTVSRVPSGQRITKGWLTIKRQPTDPDAQALYQVTVTITPDANGNVIAADGSQNVRSGYGSALLHWRIPRTISVGLPIGPDLPYDVQVLASSGLYATMEKGVIRVQPQTTLSL